MGKVQSQSFSWSINVCETAQGFLAMHTLIDVCTTQGNFHIVHSPIRVFSQSGYISTSLSPFHLDQDFGLGLYFLSIQVFMFYYICPGIDPSRILDVHAFVQFCFLLSMCNKLYTQCYSLWNVIENSSLTGHWDFTKKSTMTLLIISLSTRIIYWRKKHKFSGKC